MKSNEKPELRRDCPVCGKPQVGTLVAPPAIARGDAVYWHEDGSGDDCSPKIQSRKQP